MLGTPRHCRFNDLVAADYARQQDRKIAAARRLLRRQRGSLPPSRARHRRDEAIAPARVADDEAISFPSIAQRLAHRRDMDPQSTFVDDCVRPHATD